MRERVVRVLTVSAVVSFWALPSFGMGPPKLTAAQQADAMKQINAALAQIPDCWKNCDVGAPKVVIEDSKVVNAYFSGDDNTMIFNSIDFIKSGFDAGVSQDKAFNCSNGGGGNVGDLFSPLARVITHELAHKQQNTCNPDGFKTLWGFNPLNKSGKTLVNEFLSLSYKDNYQALQKDPQFVSVRTQMRDLVKKMPLDAKGYAQWCNLSAQRNALEAKYHMPSRYKGDDHAAEAVSTDQNIDTGGMEYFAMAIEEMMWDPGKFCGTYNDNEVAWIKKNYGDCLSKFPGGVKAPCYYPNTQSGKSIPAVLHP